MTQSSAYALRERFAISAFPTLLFFVTAFISVGILVLAEARVVDDTVVAIDILWCAAKHV